MTQAIDQSDPRNRALDADIRVSVNYKRTPHIDVALFDFDGTISTIRAGWQSIMLPMFVKHLSACPRLRAGENEASLTELSKKVIADTTGIDTFLQMVELNRMVSERGGDARTPHEYKAEYLSQLDEMIAGRKSHLRSMNSDEDREHFMIPGARQLLSTLRARNVKMYLASGTDEHAVLEEAKLLNVDHFFEGRISGARLEEEQTVLTSLTEDSTDMRANVPPLTGKRRVISEILKHVNARHLITFGDGIVELKLTHDMGGATVAIASTEENPTSGNFDAFKAKKLAPAASVLVPNLLKADKVLRLFGM